MTIINAGQINLINDQIDVNDRGLTYGDGLFETIAYVNGRLHNWHLHWQRLLLGAERLSLSIPEEDFLLNNINLKLKENNNSDDNQPINKVVKIIISRGTGGRGYQFPQQTRSTVIINVHQWPKRSAGDYAAGIKVIVCRTCLAQQPLLAGIKHLNRLEQVLARNEFNGNDYSEGIMLACSDNSSVLNDRIIEGTSSNLFFVKNGQLFIPEIDTCGVQGTIRQEILHLLEKMSITFEQGHYPLSMLSDASEVFFTNSIFGIIPVTSISLSDETQWFYSLASEQRISAGLSKIINKALNRPELL